MILEKDFRLVANYVKSEGGKINYDEYLFQAKNHPDYPNIVSLTDTLSFFNIDNGVIHVESSDIELLPNRFVTLLKNLQNNQPQLYFIEKKGDQYFYSNDEKSVSIPKEELESRWNNIVLLVEPSEGENSATTKVKKWFWALSLLCAATFVASLLLLQQNWQIKLFFLFPILGILFSIVSLKKLFNIQNEFLDNFCDFSSATNCETVIHSKKWKLLDFVNFSDLSIVFFCSQFLGLLIFAYDYNAFFSIQNILLLTAVPVLFVSIYYQKFVEKKWCPICLIIIATIVLEIFSLGLFKTLTFYISLPSIIRFGFVFLLVSVGWFSLKNILSKQKELEEFHIKGNQFMRNYAIFKNTLLTNPIKSSSILSSGLLLGNAAAPLKITLVTSPFCKFCAETHTIIERILEKHPEQVCFNISFNFNSSQEDEKSKKLHQQLVAIYYNNGQEAFIKALHNWFENNDESKPGNIIIEEKDELRINETLNEHFKWNQENELTYTPVILINQYIFPKEYDRNNLIHFINDLSDDEDFQL
ncbi:hypothetical protein FLA105534_04870 [Flavobacterium bizetiae]|uniref:Vitamin K epoxide reductase domain-containing protein n=1 Tax=Flavobacterium bizetiae TaxID=2704140 RepID=A0A6J4GZ55_9FLAO|nr:vitamin K epoxide reductase family protein [Flavobacterium bizetiae]CAA9203690.1 hypothetical protein FLA105534_04870 [Flavobacterium bizetiae]CAD5344938.1 hypothetical protein FLA105535_04950 [Flavobacterium bizetiae]CAD5350908.1 hypothetical protein FLA105534_04909 [Flavobacterium bizetiae]